MIRKEGTPRLGIVVVAMVLLSAVGCTKRPTLPETYPVHGKAVFPGGEPVPGGVIKFESQSDGAVVANGEIGGDGTFTVSTFKVGVRAPGAIAGPHRVIVIFSDDFSGGIPSRPGIPSGGALSVVLPDLCTIQPEDNKLTLTVPKASR
jgi:hypothetical protein